MKHKPCRWCGQYHDTKCPLVKSFEFYEDGTLKRVEFMTSADVPPKVDIGPLKDVMPDWGIKN